VSGGVTRPTSSGPVPFLAAPGFVVGFFVTDLWPGIGVVVGIVGVGLAVAFFLWPRAPRWIAWLAFGVALGMVALFLLALIQMLNPNATPSSGEGSGSAAPR
jgi:hypothetical protein